VVYGVRGGVGELRRMPGASGGADSGGRNPDRGVSGVFGARARGRVTGGGVGWGVAWSVLGLVEPRSVIGERCGVRRAEGRCGHVIGGSGGALCVVDRGIVGVGCGGTRAWAGGCRLWWVECSSGDSEDYCVPGVRRRCFVFDGGVGIWEGGCVVSGVDPWQWEL